MFGRQKVKTVEGLPNLMYKRKINNLPIYRSDHELFLGSLMALLRLKIIDNDDNNGYLIMTI